MESTEARHNDSNLKFKDVDAMRESSLRLTYLSYDARRVLEAFQGEKETNACNIFYQATLILWCHNYSAHKTYEVIFKHFKTSLCYTIDSVNVDVSFERKGRKPKRYDDEDLSRVTDEEMTPEEKKQRQKVAARRARKIQNDQEQSDRPKFSKFNLAKEFLDLKKFYYLYLIDRNLLLADWGARLDILFRIFSKIEESDFTNLLNEIATMQGRCNMWLVSNKLEEFIGTTEHAADDMKNSRHVVKEKPLYHLSDGARQKAIDDLNEERRNRGEKPHGYS